MNLFARALPIVGPSVLALLVGNLSSGATVIIAAPPATTDPSALLPPFFPRDESPVNQNPPLARRCEETLQAFRVKHRFRFGIPMFTRAADWGDVVRIDYKDSTEVERPHRFNRVVCFQRRWLVNFNIGYYENVPDDPKQRIWFAGVILQLDGKP